MVGEARWGRAGGEVMKDPTLLSTAEEPIGGWDGVGVWGGVFRGGVGVAWPMETG